MFLSLYGIVYPVNTESEVSSDTSIEVMGTSQDVSAEEKCSVIIDLDNETKQQTCKPLRQCLSKSSSCCQQHPCKLLVISLLCLAAGGVVVLIEFNDELPGFAS